MSDVLIYDKATGKILQYLPSVNTPDFLNRDDCIINPPKEILAAGLDSLKISEGTPIALTPEEKAAIEAEKPSPVEKIETTIATLISRIDDLTMRLEKLEK